MTLAVAEKRKCSMCKQEKSWGTSHKTCDECRGRAKQAKSAARKGDLTMEEAMEVVERSSSGLQDKDLATLLKVSLETFEEWREKGQMSSDTEDPYYLIFWEVNKERVRIKSEKLEAWKNGPTFQSQLAWMKYAFPEEQPMRPPAAPKIPDKPISLEKVAFPDIEYI